MQRRRLIKSLTLVMVILAAAATFVRYDHFLPWSDKAPAVTFSIIDGRRIGLHELKGRPVVVHFWATTCTECRREIPRLRALYRELHPLGLEFIAVAMPYDPPNRVLNLAREAPLSYPVALDIHAAATTAFGDVSLTPTTFLIAPDGQIVFRKTGPLNFDKLRQKIKDLLPEQSQVTSHKSQGGNAGTDV